MAEMVTCPTCRVMLRVPPSAEMIRCPQCKTVVAIQPAVAPPPPPVKPAIPLPFGSAPAAPPPPAPEPPPIAKSVTRAKVIPEYEEVDDDNGDDDTRPRRGRGGLSDSEKEERQLRELKRVTKPARIGTRLLAYGSLCACANPFAIFALFFLSLFKLSLGGWFWLPVVPLIFQWILTFAGFTLCCGGPKLMRSMAVAGVFVQSLQILAWIGLCRMMVQHITGDAIGFNGLQKDDQYLSTILYSTVFNNLVGVVNLPLIMNMSPDIFTPGKYAMILVAAGADFARLCLIGMLANHYAVEGKSPGLGYESMRFVYRMFGAMIFGVFAKVVVVGLNKFGAGELFTYLPSIMLINAYMMWSVFAWFTQFQTLTEVAEVIDAKRFADKRGNLDRV